MTGVAEAERRIIASMAPFTVARRPLDACYGLILAAQAHAERDQPPFDRVTMDGIAIAYSAWQSGQRRFQRAGTQAAGAPAMTLPGPEHCIEIMTGAMLPVGADTIVPVERLTEDGAFLCIEAEARVTQHQFVHPRGSDGRQGATLLTVGTRLGAPEIAVLAGAGYAELLVAAEPALAVISTGDELVDLRTKIEPQQIRSTNEFAIAASLESRRLAKVTRARLKDDEAELLDAIDALHESHAALILSGGVSMGQFDFVPAVLERLGAKVVFHKIQQKPGRPMWFGLSNAGKPIFALPGNPVSALVCTRRYIVPAFEAAARLAPRPAEFAALTEAVVAPPHLTYFLPVKTHWSGDGLEYAVPCPTNTSGDFISLAGTDGFVELAPGREHYPAGTVARLFRW